MALRVIIAVFVFEVGDRQIGIVQNLRSAEHVHIQSAVVENFTANNVLSFESIDHEIGHFLTRFAHKIDGREIIRRKIVNIHSARRKLERDRSVSVPIKITQHRMIFDRIVSPRSGKIHPRRLAVFGKFEFCIINDTDIVRLIHLKIARVGGINKGSAGSRNITAESVVVIRSADVSDEMLLRQRAFGIRIFQYFPCVFAVFRSVGINRFGIPFYPSSRIGHNIHECELNIFDAGMKTELRIIFTIDGDRRESDIKPLGVGPARPFDFFRILIHIARPEDEILSVFS